jgi:hypothetical protein
MTTVSAIPPVTWRQALAWRLGRQHLIGPGTESVADVVRHVSAVQAQVASSAELATRVRRTTSRPGDVARALAAGTVLKTWAMRGTLDLLTPDEGAAFLSLVGAGRPWERPGWLASFGLTPVLFARMREIVRDSLDGRTVAREDLIEAIVARPSLRHLADELRSGWGSLFKPFAWLGDLCFGPSQGSRVTFRRPDQASPEWRGLPDPDAAVPVVVAAYVRAYGPSSAAGFGQWVGFGHRRARDWFRSLGDDLAMVDVEGETRYILAEDLEELLTTPPTDAVRLVPGFDQWILGPGTTDAHVVPPARRHNVSRQSGWIAPTVIHAGVVSGTWKNVGSSVAVEWFGEAGRVPRLALAGEVTRLSDFLGTELRLAVSRV